MAGMQLCMKHSHKLLLLLVLLLVQAAEARA
jgi:hypothetical protein